MKSAGKWRQHFKYLGSRMLRKKEVQKNEMKTELRRCLNTPQLTLLGIGSTIGVGIYVMLGVMAKENTGPSVVFSFIAAISVTLMNALVFAEFATYIPQTGAAYIYSYKVLGEFAAFLCGWVMVVTLIFSNSVGARAWSGMLDSFFNNTIQAKTLDIFGKIQFGMPFAESLDIVAFAFQMVMILIVSCNVLFSSIVNTILGTLTVSVLLFVFVTGLIYGDAKNFINVDHGGFFPFGVAGVIKGASLALYATSGFETISLSAEEAKNPAKAVPRAMIAELFIVGIVYIAAAIGMLFLIPYWLIDLRAPLPSAFEYAGVLWGKVIVTIGPLFGITNLQMLGLYGLSRLTYRMAKDGLFFQWFLNVNKKTGVPLNSVICLGMLTAVSALLFDLSYVVKVTVILMLLNYMIVGSALIKLKITESNRVEPLIDQDEEAAPEKQVKHEKHMYEHDLIISEYETCESAESGDADVTEADGNGLAGGASSLIDFGDSASATKGDADKTMINSLGEFDLIQVAQADVTDKPLEIVQEQEDQDSSVAVENIQLNVSSSNTQDVLTVTYEPDESIDDDDNVLLFQKTTRNLVGSEGAKNQQQLHQKKSEGNDSEENHEPITQSRTPKRGLAFCFSLCVPGVLSVNKLIALHWVCCVTLAMEVNFGHNDLLLFKPVAVLSTLLLTCLLVFFSVLLRFQTGNVRTEGFQTPLMPLIPTLSVLFSSTLLFSAGEMTGFIEIGTLLFIGAIMYVAMVLMGSRAESELGDQNDDEQKKALVGGSGEEADDEVDTEDEL